MVTRPIAKVALERSTWASAPRVVAFDLIFDEDLEFPVFFFDIELMQLTALGGVRDEQGNFRFPDEEAETKAIKLTTLCCGICLQELMDMQAAAG